MSLKQDRQGVRTATDLERKYNFNKNFEHILKVAENAQAAANEAKKNVTELDQNLTSYVDGKVDGVYKDIEATDSAMREYVDASDATNKAYVDNSIATANTYAVAKAKNAFYQTDANGNVSLSGISAYPTTAGVYRVISKVAGLPDDINGYGTLAIFNAGSYILNLYLDANGLLYYARTADGVAVPTSWKVCGGKRCIWNNPSPSADFASQKVSRDLSEYNFVSIKFAFHKTLNSYEYCWWERCPIGEAGSASFTSIGGSSYPVTVKRNYSVAEDGVSFGTGAYHQGTTNNLSDASRAIPLAIYVE